MLVLLRKFKQVNWFIETSQIILKNVFAL